MQNIANLIAIGIWYTIIFAIMFLIGKLILFQLKNELRPSSKESLNKDTSNPFDDAIESRRKIKNLFEAGFGKYIGTIAVVTSALLFQLIYHLSTEIFSDFITKLMQYRQITESGVIILSFFSGLSFSKKLMHGTGSHQELFEGDMNLFIQRRKGIIMFVLAFMFFALLYGVLAKFDGNEYDLIQPISISFIVGNGIYIIFRYYKFKSISFPIVKRKTDLEDETKNIDSQNESFLS